MCGGLKVLTCILLRSLLRLIILHGKCFDSAVRSSLPLLIAFLLSSWSPPRLLRVLLALVLLALLLSLLPSTTLCSRPDLCATLRPLSAAALRCLSSFSVLHQLLPSPPSSTVFTSSTTSTFAFS